MQPTSITHQHLLAALRTEQTTRGGRRVDVLDAGCGDGQLIAFLHAQLGTTVPVASWRYWGFDVVDSLSNRVGFPGSTVDRLLEHDDTVDWSDRIRAVSIADSWPFPDEQFDFVVSNQVLEHVSDLHAFLSEMRRVLRPGGTAINLFPLRNSLLEGHVFVPFAAQISGNEQRQSLVRLTHRIGIGRRGHRARGAAGATHASDYVHYATFYRTWQHLVSASKRVGLRISYRYTPEFYAQKVRQLLGRDLSSHYRSDRFAVADWLSFVFLRYTVSVCIVFDRPPIDTRWGRH